ncbi:P-loop containing nucleoside triphosphate hydrolase protein [Apiosordaria backusii]|uniref:RNA helicase n=1 Tax=Apiosordaria backusii TaxID=314023 RepID=A0AA40EN80_9PEZI|nr:P-loop containing nucleoside triphosphate hydrolase protein [Apiosordaria backusii]
MKRKLNQDDEEPLAAAVAEEQQQPEKKKEKKDKKKKTETTTEPEKELSFAELGLDPRLVQAGEDVLCKAKTGSGKTAAYVLPVLEGVLKLKKTENNTTSAPYTAGLILVPTRELADQVYKVIEELSVFCGRDVTAAKLTENVSDAVERSLLANGPDVVVSTPARAWKSVEAKALKLEKLRWLVLDEADLVLRGVQTTMMSATLLSAELDTLKGILKCRNPTVLELSEEFGEEDEKLTQFYVKCGEDDKWLISYLIFKLQLIKGPCLIFVGDIDRSYRLKLFFEQFSIRSCILNSELPVNTRIKVIEEFNRGIYDIIIASDERKEQQGEEGGKRDEEYGVSRGIDFKNVAAVVNFDLPTSASSYTHRIGRTARAGRTGIAISFVIPKDLYGKHKPTSIKSCERDEKVLAKIVRAQAKMNRKLEPYNFSKEQMEAFRYRMNDALRAVTKVAIREARTRELRQELLRSETLKRYFEENPAELSHLRHDGELGHKARQQAHLKHVPDYLLPKEAKKELTKASVGFVPFKKLDKDKKHKGKFGGKGKGRSFKVGGGRKGDPLKTFKVRRKK